MSCPPIPRSCQPPSRRAFGHPYEPSGTFGDPICPPTPLLTSMCQPSARKPSAPILASSSQPTTLQASAASSTLTCARPRTTACTSSRTHRANPASICSNSHRHHPQPKTKAPHLMPRADTTVTIRVPAGLPDEIRELTGVPFSTIMRRLALSFRDSERRRQLTAPLTKDPSQ